MRGSSRSVSAFPVRKPERACGIGEVRARERSSRPGALIAWREVGTWHADRIRGPEHGGFLSHTGDRKAPRGTAGHALWGHRVLTHPAPAGQRISHMPRRHENTLRNAGVLPGIFGMRNPSGTAGVPFTDLWYQAPARRDGVVLGMVAPKGGWTAVVGGDEMVRRRLAERVSRASPERRAGERISRSRGRLSRYPDADGCSLPDPGSIRTPSGTACGQHLVSRDDMQGRETVSPPC